MENGISKTVFNEGYYGFHTAERKTRYFEQLSTKYYKRYSWSMVIATLIGAIIAIVSAFSNVIPFPLGTNSSQLIVLLGTSVLTVGGFAVDSSRKAMMLHAVYTRCSLIRYKYKMLWLEIENELVGDKEILERLDSLSGEQDDATGIAGFFGIMKDEELNKQANKDTNEVMKIQYQN